jgi:hypothetical protein
MRVPTQLIEYHPKTRAIALFLTDGEFWIGCYNRFLTHQSGEPPYHLIGGRWTDMATAQAELRKLTGDEF